MIIEKVIFSVDDNPKYKDLWPIVSEICFKRLGITPVLFHITDQDSDFIDDEYGIVKKIKAIDGIKTGIQSQLVRMWGTSFFQDEVCLTSDIDMIMINKKYFVDQVKDIDQNDLVIYCSDAYDSSRSECVGIYGGDRYPICYNAAKGKTFSSILETDCSFESYINRVLSMGFPDFDSDEMYFGHMVNNKNHGVNVIKLIRGFYSKFKCPGRIDRIDDSIFNKYDDRLIYNGHYIDCHLARPQSKYSLEMASLKRKILRDKEVYLIGCHIENTKQLSLLSELIGELDREGKDYIITSHTMIPEIITKNSVGFIYDSINPKYKTWELNEPNKYTINCGNFAISSPYVTYGRKDYYHVGTLRLLINGINYIKNTEYEVIHWIEYDALPNFSEDSKNVKELNSIDFIFYGIGSKFSFLTKSVNENFLSSKNSDILNLLEKNNYVAERVIMNHLIEGDIKFIDVADKPDFYGRYSHNNEVDFDWSFYEENGTVNIFINNSGKNNLRFEIAYGENSLLTLESRPFTWMLNPIVNKEAVGEVTLAVNQNTIAKIDLSDIDTYNRVVKSVEINFKQ